MNDPYARVPYGAHAYAEAHPDRLAVVARLARWAAPEVTRARVLDLGCARGGHVLPMAEALPEARFVGVDASRAQIDEASAVARACRVGNARFVAARFEDAALEAGAFDYVIAHGVWSWVAPEARRALLRVVARALADDGVAYVSFNVLPGWYERMAARDWLRFAEGAFGAGVRDDPRAALAWLAARAPNRAALGAVAARLAETDRAYAIHEYLADEHHAESVTTFLAEAEDAGLRYLGDAIPAETAIALLDDEAQARARALPAAAAQRLVDFVRGTAFRRALLVRADAADARGWAWSPDLDPGAVASLRVACREVSQTFGASDAASRCIDASARAWPRSVACAGEGLDADARSDLLDVWLAGGIELHAHEARVATAASDSPRALRVARWRAEHGGPIVNAWHHDVVLAEPVVREVLARLDGETRIGRIAGDLGVSRELAGAAAELLARAGLLVARDG
jgi:SAM-dependent methyltransferase